MYNWCNINWLRLAISQIIWLPIKFNCCVTAIITNITPYKKYSLKNLKIRVVQLFFFKKIFINESTFRINGTKNVPKRTKSVIVFCDILLYGIDLCGFVCPWMVFCGPLWPYVALYLWSFVVLCSFCGLVICTIVALYRLISRS